MPNLCVAVREGDEELWKRAVELAGEDVAAARVTDALTRLVAEREADGQGFGPIEIQVPVLSANNWVVGMRAVAFQGKELARHSPHPMAHSVAFRTRKGKLLIQRASDQGPRFGVGGPYLVYETLSEARAAVDSRGEPLYDAAFLDEVARALGERHVEELDL
ncbi:MAG: hypothetical protein SCH98_16060 [Deferrisomatales bacterium]|nr:hypothetical protein [Deferrisomatales bacterium]